MTAQWLNWERRMTREDLLKPAANTWLQICPKCQQLWFIGGAQAADHYHCKACGWDFVIGFEHLPPLNSEKNAESVRH
jgi:predicted RNA-binding Zn-ribbon protein involved in translation (DUF1610 family)